MAHPIRSFVMGLALALVLLGTADIILRMLEPHLSGNMAATKAIPRQIAELSQSDAKKTVAIGNSLLGDGLDPQAFQSSLSQYEQTDPVKVIKLVPDGSSIWDWYCIVNHGVGKASSSPDLVILGFAWEQLTDQTRLNITRSFNALCPVVSMREIQVLSGQVGANEWLEMLTVKVSKLYAQREALRHRTLRAFVPSYEDVTQTINDRAGMAGTAEAAAEASVATRSYAALEAMLRVLSDSGSRVVLVAMPVTDTYEIDPGLCALVARAGHLLLDMRGSIPPTSLYFRDALHMNQDGARLFSEALGTELRLPDAQTHRCGA